MLGDTGYKRYRTPQTLDTANKVSEKGKLTNILLTGAYEVLDGTIYTVKERHDTMKTIYYRLTK